MTRTFAIAGANLAGGSAAIALRKEGFDGRIILIGEEAHAPYERPPLSKEYLRGEEEFDEFLLRPADYYEKQAIELRLGQRVERVRPAHRELELPGAERIPYDALLLATGGRNRRLNIPGIDLAGVYSLRTVADADRIRAHAGPGARALVVGMGFIGCEVAASLRQSGVDVVAVEPLARPLARAVPPEIGHIVETVHRDRGVELLLGDAVVEFQGRERVERAVTRGGRTVACDLAVVGVGIVPETSLVEGTGIEVEDGAVVDEYCRTSDPVVFAAGDVARHYHPLVGRHIRVEHWQNAIRQGEAAARSMLGRREPYADVHWFWSDQYDHNLQYCGFYEPADDVVFRGEPDSLRFCAFYLRDGAVRACFALNRPRDVRQGTRLIGAAARVSPDDLADESADLRKLAAGA